MLTSTALVLMMSVPALALFYGGMVRSKNMLSMLMQVFVVFSLIVVHLVERTDLDSEGAVARFQGELDRLGVNAALEAAGVEPGDTVRIADAEFEYQP